jgi:hypothetical protein
MSDRLKNYKPTDANLHDALLHELTDCSGDLRVFRENLSETVEEVIDAYAGVDTYLEARRQLVEVCTRHREALMSDACKCDSDIDCELWAALGHLNEAFEKENPGRKA